jgi:hypothetical protein
VGEFRTHTVEGKAAGGEARPRSTGQQEAHLAKNLMAEVSLALSLSGTLSSYPFSFCASRKFVGEFAHSH